MLLAISPNPFLLCTHIHKQGSLLIFLVCLGEELSVGGLPGTEKKRDTDHNEDPQTDPKPAPVLLVVFAVLGEAVLFDRVRVV